jgi:hypothetical protein
VLTGVGVYTGNDEDVMDQEAIITFDRTTTTVSVWNVDDSRDVTPEAVAEAVVTVDTAQARRAVAGRPGHLPPHTAAVHFARPVVLDRETTYEVEHNIQPTDVKNFFSGWPITRLGADLWTCYGRKSAQGSSDCLEFLPAVFRQGRCCHGEGQLRYFLVWKC